MVKTVAELYNPEEEWVISVIDEKPGIGRSCVLRVLLYYYSTWCVLSVLLRPVLSRDFGANNSRISASNNRLSCIGGRSTHRGG